MLKALVKVSGVSLAYHRLHTAPIVANPPTPISPQQRLIAGRPETGAPGCTARLVAGMGHAITLLPSI